MCHNRSFYTLVPPRMFLLQVSVLLLVAGSCDQGPTDEGAGAQTPSETPPTSTSSSGTAPTEQSPPPQEATADPETPVTTQTPPGVPGPGESITINGLLPGQPTSLAELTKYLNGAFAVHVRVDSVSLKTGAEPFKPAITWPVKAIGRHVEMVVTVLNTITVNSLVGPPAISTYVNDLDVCWLIVDPLNTQTVNPQKTYLSGPQGALTECTYTLSNSATLKYRTLWGLGGEAAVGDQFVWFAVPECDTCIFPPDYARVRLAFRVTNGQVDLTQLPKEATKETTLTTFINSVKPQ